MDAVGLPARVVYGVVALPVGGEVGFRVAMWLLPKLYAQLYGASIEDDGYKMFSAAMGTGAGVAFTLALVALTLPWLRRRRKTGRTGRIAISGVVVVVASLAFAGMEHALIYDLAFAGWLAYSIAFTYVRHGIMDRETGGRSASPDAVSKEYLR